MLQSWCLIVGIAVAVLRKDGLVLSMMGSEATFEVLNVMEYSSARGRMSVIVRAPNGSIRLYCKGSDSKVLAILESGVSKSIQDSTQANLHLFATQVRPYPHAYRSCTWSSCSAMYQCRLTYHVSYHFSVCGAYAAIHRRHYTSMLPLMCCLQASIAEQ